MGENPERKFGVESRRRPVEHCETCRELQLCRHRPDRLASLVESCLQDQEGDLGDFCTPGSAKPTLRPAPGEVTPAALY